MEGQSWSLLEPSLLQHPSLAQLSESLQRGERNINSQETDGAIIKSSRSSYFFPHCFCFSGQLPQKQIVLTLHMFILCLLDDPKEGQKTFQSWWHQPDDLTELKPRTSYWEIKTNHGCSPEGLINLNISCLLSCNSSNISPAFTLRRLFIITFTS